MKHSTSETGAWTTRRSLALLGSILFWAIVVIDIWYIWPTTLGGKTSFVVVSGSSMEPTYFGGDLVIARSMEPSVGDVIVYAPDSLGGSQIVHRIIGGNAEDGWVMQGDNNDFIDPFEPTANEVRGVVLVHYSDIGRVTALMLNPLFWAAFLLAGMVLFIWFSGDDCDDDEDLDPDADADEPLDEAESVADGDTTPGTLTRAGPVMRATALVLAATWALASGVSPAAAAQLGVNAPVQPQAFVMSACGNPAPAWGSTTTSTGTTSTQVTLSNIPAGCLNLPFTVTLRNSSGTVLSTFTGTPTTASHSFTTGTSYTVAQVATAVVKVQGWNFPTTWTPPAPPSTPAVSCVAINNAGNPTGAPCTVTITSLSGWTSYPGAWGVGTPYYHYYMSFSINTNQNRWRITVDWSNTSQFPLYNALPVFVGDGYNVVNAPGYSCSQLPTYIGAKAAGNVSGQNNGNLYVTSQPGSTNGTIQRCP